MADKLERALTHTFGKMEKRPDEIRGRLGLTIGGQEEVEVAGRPGFVYVRLRESLSEVIQARNNQVSPTYDLQVIVVRAGNVWTIKGVDSEIYGNMNSDTAYLPKHGFTHEFGSDGRPVGNDVVFVYPDQVMPLLVSPSGTYGTMQLYVAPAPFKLHTGGWVYAGNELTPSFAPYVPTGTRGVMGLVYLNTDTGAIGITINTGTTFNNSIIELETLMPYIPVPGTNQEPLKGVRLVSGTTALGWDNLYDVRQWLGGSGGGGGITSETDPVFLASEAHNFVAGDKTKLNGIEAGAEVNNISDANAMLLVSGTNITLHTHPGSGGGGVWGGITGTLSDQTDLQGALDDKLNATLGELARLLFTNQDGEIVTDEAVQILLSGTHQQIWIGSDPMSIGVTPGAGYHVLGDDGVVARFRAFMYGGNTATGAGLTTVRGGGTVASPSAVTAGTVLGQWTSHGLYDGSGTITSTRAAIYVKAAEDWTSTSQPTKIEIYTCPSSSTTLTLAMTINADGTIDIPSGKTYNIDGDPHHHPQFLPFGVYASIGPHSANSTPYAATIDRSMYLVNIAYSVYVATTNDDSNYWTIDLVDKTGTVIETLDTSTISASTFAVLSANLDEPVSESDVILRVTVTKTGSPGNLYLAGPALEILI